MSDAELRAVWLASDRLMPKTRALTRLLAMTACRLSEATNIAVSEVDFFRGRWTIPAARTKNGKALTVPLHPWLIDELRAIWPSGMAHPRYRLLGTIAGSGFTAPSKAKVRLDSLSDVENWRWHDLRRTTRTGMARLGVSDRAAEAALNHVGDRSALVKIYDKHNYQPEALAALEVWQAHAAQLISAPAAGGAKYSDIDA